MERIHNPFPFFARQIRQQLDFGAASKNWVCITGFPYDEGTRINQGRVGAEVAPKVFREGLNCADLPVIGPKIEVVDTRDIEKNLRLQEAHEMQTQKVERLLRSQATVFSIGGQQGNGSSNDQSYPNALALLQAFNGERVGVVNIDAHMDCRPLIGGLAHSGSPFRLLLEDGLFRSTGSKFVNFANQGAQGSQDHLEFILENGQRVVWLNKDIRRYRMDACSAIKTQAGQCFQLLLDQFRSEQCRHVFVSFDVDSINSAYCPGVSAPSVVGGLTSEEALEIMRLSGAQQAVKLVDFSEFNPCVENQRTAKLLAQMFHQFCQSRNSVL